MLRMPKIVWLRCFVVSLIVAAVATPLSISLSATEESEEVVDLSALEPEKLAQMSDKELSKHFETLPRVRLHGIDRFTYPFTHPQIALFYIRAALTWFLGIFVGTVVVSYLHFRKGLNVSHIASAAVQPDE